MGIPRKIAAICNQEVGISSIYHQYNGYCYENGYIQPSLVSVLLIFMVRYAKESEK